MFEQTQNFGTEKPAPKTATLRDQFAIAALTGLLANPDAAKYKDRAEVAYNYADAMLKAREHKNDTE